MTTSALEVLETRREQVTAELAKIEKQLYNIESDYLQAEYTQCGTVLKGFEGFLSSKDTLRKRARGFKVEDRAFSLSSRTSPAAIELEQQQLEANAEAGGRASRSTFASKGIAGKGRRGG